MHHSRQAWMLFSADRAHWSLRVRDRRREQSTEQKEEGEGGEDVHCRLSRMYAQSAYAGKTKASGPVTSMIAVLPVSQVIPSTTQVAAVAGPRGSLPSHKKTECG